MNCKSGWPPGAPPRTSAVTAWFGAIAGNHSLTAVALKGAASGRAPDPAVTALAQGATPRDPHSAIR